ncbi:MAG: amidase [Nitrospinae bacterium]|nr:amidase [Nitrospinota bacterium]
MNITNSTLRPRYTSGEIKPSEVMAHVLGRLDDPDQAGVWISSVEPDAAMAAARKMDERIGEIDKLPLYGLVLSIKDCIDLAGAPTTAACPEFAYTPKASGPVVEKAIEAGTLYIGKTNMDQFATGLVGVRSPYGVARNPHNPGYIPSGSSSGAAVSIATGTSSIALATDTGGSGRVPASYCSITGLKPGPGALSGRGMVHACRSFETISIFAQTPADAFMALEVLAGYDADDCFSDPSYCLFAGDAASTPLHEMRIAAPMRSQRKFFGNRDTENLFEQALATAGEVFAGIEDVDFTVFLEINDLMYFGPFLAERDVAVGDFLRARPEAGEKVVRELILGSGSQTAADVYRALYGVAEARRRLESFWRKFDALLVPTVRTIQTVDEVMREPLESNFDNGYYTHFANPLGLASISIPNGLTPPGVPHGITLLVPAGGESLLVRMAEEFLDARHKRP